MRIATPGSAWPTVPASALTGIGIGGVHIGFRHAITLQNPLPGSRFERNMSFRQQWRTTRDKQAKVLHHICGEPRVVQQARIESRHAHHAVGVGYCRDNAVNIESRLKNHLRTSYDGNIGGDEQAVSVIDGQGVQ